MKKRRRDDERTKKEHRILENYDTAARHKRTNTYVLPQARCM